jgi:hypothetical protein
MWLRMTDLIVFKSGIFSSSGMPWGFAIYCLTKSRWALALYFFTPSWRPFLRAYISCKVLATCAAACLLGNYCAHQELAELVTKISAKQQERKSFKLFLTRAASCSNFSCALPCYSSSFSSRAPKTFKDYDANLEQIPFRYLKCRTHEKNGERLVIQVI